MTELDSNELLEQAALIVMRWKVDPAIAFEIRELKSEPVTVSKRDKTELNKAQQIVIRWCDGGYIDTIKEAQDMVLVKRVLDRLVMDAQPDYEAAARALGYQQIRSGTWFHPNQHPNFTERFKSASDIFDRYFGKHWLAPSSNDVQEQKQKFKCPHCGEVSDTKHDGACGAW